MEAYLAIYEEGLRSLSSIVNVQSMYVQLTMWNSISQLLCRGFLRFFMFLKFFIRGFLKTRWIYWFVCITASCYFYQHLYAVASWRGSVGRGLTRSPSVNITQGNTRDIGFEPMFFRSTWLFLAITPIFTNSPKNPGPLDESHYSSLSATYRTFLRRYFLWSQPF